MAWMVCREGEQAPEYYRGEIFGFEEAWTRDADRAYVFLKRRAAEHALRDAAPGGDPMVRIVPTFTGVDA
jgi:hypothetical protein